MNYVVKGKKIDLPSGKQCAFKYAIREIVEIDSVIVVCLEVPTNRKLEENVYAINQEGELLWQIPKTEHAIRNSRYVGIRRAGNLVRAFNYDGMVYELDPNDGKILNRYFGK